MRNYFVVKIPFADKGACGNKRASKHKVEGVHYYIVDEFGLPFDNFVIIEKATKYCTKENFTTRKTDWAQNKNCGEWAINNLKYSQFDNPEPLTQIELKKVNEFSMLQQTTGLNTIALLSGSNSSGGVQNPSSTEIRLNGGKYNYLNYVVGFSALQGSRKVSEERLDFIQNGFKNIMTFEDYVLRFKSNTYTFYAYNAWSSLTDLCVDENEVNKAIDLMAKRLRNVKSNTSEFLELIRKIQTQMKEDKEIKRLAKSLRTQLRTNLINEHINKFNNETNFSSIDGDDTPLNVLDAAHIIPVEKLIKDSTQLVKIIDPENGLLLPKDVHKMFDDRKIRFDQNGTIIRKDNSLSARYSGKIKAELLSQKRIESINECNKIT